MFKWEVEEMALMNEKSFFCSGGHKVYNCEFSISRDEKIAFFDSMQDGKLSYILSLHDKFVKDYESMPKNCFGDIKEGILDKWAIENDSRSILKIYYPSLYIEKFITHSDIYDINRIKPGSIYYNFVDESFHRQLVICEKKEEEYFHNSDEYSILKDKLIRQPYKTTFGVHLSFCSNGDVYVVGKNSCMREITIEELLQLLDGYKQLDDLVKKISSEINIDF